MHFKTGVCESVNPIPFFPSRGTFAGCIPKKTGVGGTPPHSIILESAWARAKKHSPQVFIGVSGSDAKHAGQPRSTA